MENILLTSPKPLENGKANIAPNTNASEITKTIALKNYSEKIMVALENVSTKWHIQENEHGSISIPYFDENNNEIDVKVYDSSNNFIWQKGIAPEIYGLWRLPKYDDNYLILATSEQDCHILWANSLQAIGITTNNIPIELPIILEKYDYIITIDDNTDSSRILFGDLVDKISIDKIYKLNLHSLGYTNLLDIHSQGQLNYDLVESNSKSKLPIKKNKEDLHVNLGDRLIAEMHLKYFNDKLYSYVNGVYKGVSDKHLNSYIVKNLYKGAKDTLKKDIRNYVKDYLQSDDAISVDTNYINFINGLYDIKNNRFIPHTPDIFTVNQLPIKYIENMPISNRDVDKFLDDIAFNNSHRKEALLQMIGYCMTSKNDIQKFMIFYGPTASNGKSTTIKLIENIIGMDNISHKDLHMLTTKFGVSGIQNKLLNTVSELPQQKIKDASVLKNTVTGDSFETFVIYEGTTSVICYVKHIFATNHLPYVADSTNGFYRRVNILLFENQFDTKSSNFKIDTLLTEENLDYLANLALRAYIKMVSSNNLEFANQAESDNLVSNYKQLSDSIYGFLHDEDYSDIFDFSQPAVTTNMLAAYRTYCRLNNLKPFGKQEFYSKLQTDYGFVKKKINGNYYFCQASMTYTQNQANITANHNN